MNKNSFIKKTKNLIKNKKFMAKTINHNILEDLGFFVIKNAFPSDTVEKITLKNHVMV